MTQLSKTFERPSSLLPAAAAGLLVAGAIAIGAFAVGFGVGTQAGVTDAAAAPDLVVPAPAAVAPAPVAVRTDRAAILSRLDSEYLRQISAGWYVTGSRSAIDPNQFQSEYLREISAGWYAPVAVRTDRAAILSRLDSEYLRQISAGWYVTGSRSAIDPNQFQSEYLREISAGW